MAGSTIDLDEIATSEILDPRQIEGLHSGVCSRNVLTEAAELVNGDHASFTPPLRLLLPMPTSRRGENGACQMRPRR
jgi:hypothetical protein